MREAYPSARLARLLAIAAGVGVFSLALRSIYIGQGQSYDTLLYARSLWGMAHGHWFNPAYGTHVFGIHANVALLPLAPLTWLLPAAVVLAAAQAVALTATLDAVARHARHTAITAVGLATLSPLVLNPWLFDLRPGLLAIPLLTGALLRLRAHGTLDARAIALCAAAALVREEFAVVAAAGVTLAPGLRSQLGRRAGVAAVLLAYMAVYWFFLRDAFSGGAGARADQAASDLLAASQGAWAYRAQLAAALAATGGGVIWLGWRWLGAALPGLGLAVLLAKQPEHALSFHYTMFAAPGLLVALVDGLERVRHARATLAALGVAVATSLAFGSIPGGARFQADAFGFAAEARPWQGEVHDVLASWPPHEGALAPGAFSASVADRETIYSMETATRHVAEHAEPPPGLAVALLPAHEWNRLGRWLVHRGGFQLERIVAGRFALLRAGRIDAPNPMLASMPETPLPCPEPTVVWPAAGLAACRVATPDGERVALLRIGSPSAPGRALALEVVRDNQPIPAAIAHGLINPSQLPERRWTWLELPTGPQAGDRIRLLDGDGRVAPALDPTQPSAPPLESAPLYP